MSIISKIDIGEEKKNSYRHRKSLLCKLEKERENEKNKRKQKKKVWRCVKIEKGKKNRLTTKKTKND